MSYLSADWVLIPTEADTEANAGIYKIAKDIQQYSKRNMCHAKILGIIMNRYKSNSNFHKSMFQNLATIGKEVGTFPFYTCIPETVKAGEARLYKKTLNQYDKKLRISESFSSLVDEIISRLGGI
jgi:cellulose biosynthesis protein BcsQ